MNAQSKHALLLVGSPRGFKSTSSSLGSYLLEKLRGGFETERVHVQAALHSKEAKEKMLMLAGESDLLILAFPLYADYLPAPMIAALEALAKQRQTAIEKRTQRLIVIVNNGFPESSQNAIAVQICRRFALEAGIEWAGGLSLGGGGAISGVALEEAGFVAKNAVKSLDLAAKDLLENKVVSPKAVELMGKLSIPKCLYIFMSNRGWKQQAKQCGVENKLYDRV